MRARRRLARFCKRGEAHSAGGARRGKVAASCHAATAEPNQAGEDLQESPAVSVVGALFRVARKFSLISSWRIGMGGGRVGRAVHAGRTKAQKELMDSCSRWRGSSRCKTVQRNCERASARCGRDSLTDGEGVVSLRRNQRETGAMTHMLNVCQQNQV